MPNFSLELRAGRAWRSNGMQKQKNVQTSSDFETKCLAIFASNVQSLDIIAMYPSHI